MANCTDPCVVLSIGNTASGVDTLHITNLDTGNTTLINDPLISNGELAKLGNKFWILNHGAFKIEEFEILSNCSVSHLRTIAVPSSWWASMVQGLNGMAAKNQNTLVVGSVDVSAVGGGDYYEIDISGSTATWNLLFHSEGNVKGDLVYNPADNTIASFEFKSGWNFYGIRARQYDYNTGPL